LLDHALARPATPWTSASPDKFNALPAVVSTAIYCLQLSHEMQMRTFVAIGSSGSVNEKDAVPQPGD
jgi:hypothetical protein